MPPNVVLFLQVFTLNHPKALGEADAGQRFEAMAGNVCVRVAHKRYEDRGRSAVIGHGKDTHSQDLTEEQAFSQAVAAD
jgi:hypothetical protein